MLRLRRVCKGGVLAVAAGLTMASNPIVTSQDQDHQDKAANQAQGQAWAHDQLRTYYDTPEDRLMRELTDDGAHDRSDTQR